MFQQIYLISIQYFIDNFYFHVIVAFDYHEAFNHYFFNLFWTYLPKIKIILNNTTYLLYLILFILICPLILRTGGIILLFNLFLFFKWTCDFFTNHFFLECLYWWGIGCWFICFLSVVIYKLCILDFIFIKYFIILITRF